jgi:hypothetical protein
MTADTPGQGTLDTAGTIVVLRDLTTRAETAHGVYETEVLHGVRDEEWPQWYANTWPAPWPRAATGSAVARPDVRGLL